MITIEACPAYFIQQMKYSPQNVLPWDFQTTRQAAEIGNLMVRHEADAPSISQGSSRGRHDDTGSYLLGLHPKDQPDGDSHMQNQPIAQSKDTSCDLTSGAAFDVESPLLLPLEPANPLEQSDTDSLLLETITGHQSRSSSHSRTNLSSSNTIRSSQSPGRIKKSRVRRHALPAAPPAAPRRSERSRPDVV